MYRNFLIFLKCEIWSSRKWNLENGTSRPNKFVTNHSLIIRAEKPIVCKASWALQETPLLPLKRGKQVTPCLAF